LRADTSSLLSEHHSISRRREPQSAGGGQRWRAHRGVRTSSASMWLSIRVRRARLNRSASRARWNASSVTIRTRSRSESGRSRPPATEPSTTTGDHVRAEACDGDEPLDGCFTVLHEATLASWAADGVAMMAHVPSKLRLQAPWRTAPD